MLAIFVANYKFAIFAKYAIFTKMATLNGNLWLCYYLFAKLGEFSLFLPLGAFLDMSGWIGPKHSKNEVVIVSNGRFLL